jgi:ParB family chromosome partitioning protein
MMGGIDMPDDGFPMLGEALDVKSAAKPVTPVEVVRVPVQKVVPNPYQPRKEFDEEALADLAASIKQVGVLQPLLVAPYGDGRFLLIAGERRLRASKLAGVDLIPVIISEYTPEQMAEIAMIENLQREDLHFLEEAEGYEKLMTQFQLTQDGMASRVGKKQSTVANKLRLLKLSPAVRMEIRKQGLSERHARALLKLEGDDSQLKVIQVVVKKKLNVRQTENLIENLLSAETDNHKNRIVIVNDVRIYVNSIKQIYNTIQKSGIPAQMTQDLEGDEVVVTLRIKNTKGNKHAK